MNLNVSKEALQTAADDIILDCIYSSKKYFNDADTLNGKHVFITNCSIFLSGLTGFVGIVGAGSFQESVELTFPSIKHRILVFSIFGFCSFVVSGLNLLLKSQDYASKAVAARNIAGEYLALRKRVSFFKNLNLPDLDIEKAVELLKGFNESIINIDHMNPPLFDEASYTKAQLGIERGEAKYDTDKSK